MLGYGRPASSSYKLDKKIEKKLKEKIEAFETSHL